MKRKLAFLTLGFCCIAAYSQTKGPVITFKETDHNFGIFDQQHADLSYYFKFTNTGDEDLVITDVYTSCNCTVSEYPKKAIAPGQSDSIKVSYDGSSRRPGVFRKIVTVNYNAKTADDSFARITITGEMTDKAVVDQIKNELDAEYKQKK